MRPGPVSIRLRPARACAQCFNTYHGTHQYWQIHASTYQYVRGSAPFGPRRSHPRAPRRPERTPYARRAVGNQGAKYQGPPSVHGRVAVRTASPSRESIHAKYIPIRTHTYQYVQIRTRPRTGKGPILRSARLAASKVSPVRSPYRELGCRRIRGSAGYPASSLAASCFQLPPPGPPAARRPRRRAAGRQQVRA